MKKMTLDEYLAKRPAKRRNALYVHTENKGDLFDSYGITPFTGYLRRKELYEWAERATGHLTSEQLITLTITAKMLHRCKSAMYNALKWVLYTRDISFETVNVQNPAVVQASDPVSPDLPEEPDRV
jgi:hypothetical protein